MPVPPLRLRGRQVAHLALRVGAVASWQVELARSEEAEPPGAATAPILPTRLALWRAPIDNETFGPRHAERWEQLGLPSAHERVELRTQSRRRPHHPRGDGARRTGTTSRASASVSSCRPGVVAVDWLGRGPHENYSDRRAGTTVGRWRTAVDDWPVPYVHPQASGNRTGVRWLRFLDADDRVVLTVDGLDDLDVTVSRWTDEELAAAGHLEDLPARDSALPVDRRPAPRRRLRRGRARRQRSAPDRPGHVPLELPAALTGRPLATCSRAPARGFRASTGTDTDRAEDVMGQAREVMDGITAAILSGDRAAIERLYAPDAVVEVPDVPRIEGAAAIADYHLSMHRGFPDAGFEFAIHHRGRRPRHRRGLVRGHPHRCAQLAGTAT